MIITVCCRLDSKSIFAVFSCIRIRIAFPNQTMKETLFCWQSGLVREIFLAFANRLGVTFDHQMQARPQREGKELWSVDNQDLVGWWLLVREVFLAFANKLGVTFNHQMQARPRREGFKIPNIDIGCRGSTHITSRNFKSKRGVGDRP